jgi:hypothetical protein
VGQVSLSSKCLSSSTEKKKISSDKRKQQREKRVTAIINKKQRPKKEKLQIFLMNTHRKVCFIKYTNKILAN